MKHHRRNRSWVGMWGALWLLSAAAGAQEVTLPLPAYEALRARASAEPPPPPDPPTGLAFEEAKLRVEVGETSARVITELTLFLFSDEWQSLPLPALGTFIEADLGTLEGLLTADGEASLRMRGTGRHRLRLESVVPVEKDEAATRPAWNLRLALPRAAVVHGEVIVAPTVKEVEGDAGALLAPTGEAGHWRLTGVPGSSVSLTLAAEAQAPERSELPLRFEATAATAVEISRTRHKVDVFLGVRVRQGRLETLLVPIPENLELVEVQTTGSSGGGVVSAWDLVDGKAVVELARPMEGRLGLQLELTGPPSDGELTSPLIQPEGAERVSVFSRVSVRGDGLLTLVSPGSGRRLDERQQAFLPEDQGLPEDQRGGTGQVLAVTRPDDPPRWQISWAESTEVLAAQVDRLVVDLLPGADGRAFYQLWAEARSTGAASLSIYPPAGLELAACQRDGLDFTPGEGASRGGISSFVLPLRTTGGTQLLYLAGFLPMTLPDGKERLEVPLPAFSAPVTRVAVRVLLPDSHFAQLAEAGRRGVVGALPSLPSQGTRPSLARELFGRALSATSTDDLADSLLPPPPGFWPLEAAWSALSAAPSSLVLELEQQKIRKEWF